MTNRTSTTLLSLLLFIILVSCSKENTKPVASFTIDPGTGNDQTAFFFDASNSSDLETKSEELEIIWDWEGDDEFDSQYTTRKTADHKFSPGEYMVTLVVKDLRGLTDTTMLALQVASSNLAPEIPENPKPAQNGEDYGINLNLSWDCTDPDGDMVLYNIYFGSTNPPEEFRLSHAQTSFNPGKLEYKSTYYWKVIARDIKGNVTEGPVWQFSTLNLSFEDMTDSRDSQVYSTVQIGNQWWMAENLNYSAEESFCYQDTPENCDRYGRLYTWDVAMTVCPEGWHLPSKAEFEQMINQLGGSEEAGGKLKDYENGFWRSPNTDASNLYGFGALPAGRRYDHGLYTGSGYYAQFYSSDEYNDNEAYNLTIGYDYSNAFLYNYKKKYAISVRCVKN